MNKLWWYNTHLVLLIEFKKIIILKSLNIGKYRVCRMQFLQPTDHRKIQNIFG